MKLLKMSEVQEKLSISRSAVYRLIQTGNLNPLHIGSAVRFRESEVEAFIEELK